MLDTKKIYDLIKLSFTSENEDFTKGSINRAIFLLAIPMLMEMVMESLFAVVDTYFVSKLGTAALATVGLTESMLTIVYSLGIGVSMAATAIVARLAVTRITSRSRRIMLLPLVLVLRRLCWVGRLLFLLA